MGNRPKNIGTAAVTAPTSPKPPTPADPNDLRTALTKLADKWLSNKDRPSDYQDGVADAACAIRALLAAHPAPEPEPVCGNCLGHGVETCAAHPAPVSDARRDDHAHTYRRAARAVLAVLPAPPVVDEIPEDAPPYLVGIPEDMACEPMSGDDWVEYGFDAGVLWGAWNARRSMPVVDEAEIADVISMHLGGHLPGGNVSRLTAEIAARLRGATR